MVGDSISRELQLNVTDGRGETRPSVTQAKFVDGNHSAAYDPIKILPTESDVNKIELSSIGQIIIPEWLREVRNWKAEIKSVLGLGTGVFCYLLTVE